MYSQLLVMGPSFLLLLSSLLFLLKFKRTCLGNAGLALEKDELWMKKRLGKACPIDTTGCVSSNLDCHQK